jgi:hypothetical protein
MDILLNIPHINPTDQICDKHCAFLNYVIKQVLHDVDRNLTVNHSSKIKELLIFSRPLEYTFTSMGNYNRSIILYLNCVFSYGKGDYNACLLSAQSAVVHGNCDGYFILGKYALNVLEDPIVAKDMWLKGHVGKSVACTMCLLELMSRSHTMNECLDILDNNQLFERYVFLICHKQYDDGIRGLHELDRMGFKFEVKMAIARYYFYIVRDLSSAKEYFAPLYADASYNMYFLERYDNTVYPYDDVRQINDPDIVNKAMPWNIDNDEDITMEE